MRIEEPIITKYRSMLPMTLSAYSLIFRILSSRNASLIRSCRLAKITDPTIPTARGRSTRESARPQLPTFPIPSVTPPKANTLRTNDTTSNRFPLTSSTSPNRNQAMMREITMIAAAIPKIARQLTASTTIPASVGASTGAAPTASPYQPMTVPFFSTGKMVRITTWAMDMSIPFPQACRTRPAIITEKLFEHPLTASPAMNTQIPPR